MACPPPKGAIIRKAAEAASKVQVRIFISGSLPSSALELLSEKYGISPVRIFIKGESNKANWAFSKSDCCAYVSIRFFQIYRIIVHVKAYTRFRLLYSHEVLTADKFVHQKINMPIVPIGMLKGCEKPVSQPSFAILFWLRPECSYFARTFLETTRAVPIMATKDRTTIKAVASPVSTGGFTGVGTMGSMGQVKPETASDTYFRVSPS